MGRSKTVKNTLEPKWNFSCEIDIPDQEEKYIHINVYDDDFGKDNIEGCYSLSVTEAISDIPKDGKWYSLVGCKTGKVYISTKFTPIKMADSSTEKPVQESITKVTSSDLEAQNFEKAGKIVGDIVQKAEKVIGEGLAQLNETESNVKITKEENKSNISEVTSDEKDDEFIKISKESEEIIQKMEKTFVESQTVTETSVIQDKKIEKKEESLTLQSSTKADSFQEIEKESKEIVSQLEKSFVSSEDAQDTKTENEDIVIKPGFLKVIVFKASELVNKDMIGKSDPFVRIMFRDQELKSRKVRNTLEPEWNFSANLIISSSDENSDIVLQVIDDDYGKDDFIGSYTYSLKQAIKDTDKEASWHTLVGCKTGKISFSTIYIPDEEPVAQSNEQAEKGEEESSNKQNITDVKEDKLVQDSPIKDTQEPESKQEEKDSSKEKDEQDDKDKKDQSTKPIDEEESDVKEEIIEKDSLKSEAKDTKEPEKEEIKQEDKNSSNEKDEKVDISDKDQSTRPLKAEEPDKEKDSEVSEPEAKSDNTAPDSFINEIYTAEGRQASPDKELEAPTSLKTGEDLVADIKSNDIDEHNVTAQPKPEIKQEDKNSSDEKDEKEENIPKEQITKSFESEKMDDQDSNDKEMEIHNDKADFVAKSILETTVEKEQTKEDKKSSITVEKTSSIIVEKTIQIEKNFSESQFDSLSLETLDVSAKPMQEGEDPATSKPEEKSPAEKIIQDEKKGDESKERSERNLSKESKDTTNESSKSRVE